MRIMASLTKAATVRAYRSKSRAKRRLRLIQASVRSTIQRLGRTTNLCSSLRLTISTTQRPVLAALQRAVPIPQHKVGMRGAFRRQILRQRLPLAARREHVEDRIQNLADVHLASTTTAFGRRYRRFDQRPLAVAQITRVAQAVAVGRTAVFRLPHSTPLSSDAGASLGITTDSSDSTTLWI